MSASPPAIWGHRASFLPYTKRTKPIPLGIRLRNSHVGSSDMLDPSSALFGLRLFSVRGGTRNLHDQCLVTLTAGFHVRGTWECVIRLARSGRGIQLTQVCYGTA